jgi:geranylgeranyl pyrophosphate synthase
MMILRGERQKMQKFSSVGGMNPTTATFFDLVKDHMPEVDERMRLGPGGHHENLTAAINHLLASGGKRIRPILALLSAEMLKADHGNAITLAAAIEMLHTATLVHDDLIDDALLRRGIPTLNAQWSPAATVLTGDYVFARAAHLASLTGSLSVMDLFATTLMTIVNGEITQLFHTDTPDPRQSYYERIYAKTASLFELATTGAALLSDSPADTVEAMRAFGYSIGIAFQIVDDILDFVGEQEHVGKPVGSDLRQGLITLPTLCHFETQEPADGFIGAIERRELSEAELDKLVDVIRSSDAIDSARREAESFVVSAEETLYAMEDSPARQALFEMARYIISRTA